MLLNAADYLSLTPSNPSRALLSVFWNISAAEETPKLRRVYLRNATCVVNVVMFRESSPSSSSSEILCNKYSDVFKGIGKLKDVKVKSHVDENGIPVIQPYRRIPFHIRKQVEAVVNVVMFWESSLSSS
jgi:hypothetical protein